MQFFFQGDAALLEYKTQADSYICSVLPQSPFHGIYITPGTFHSFHFHYQLKPSKPNHII